MAVDAKTGQPIYPGVPGVGLSNVGSYQSSGTPWITASLLSADQNSGSLARFDFPRVAKKIVVKVIPTAFVGGTSTEISDPVHIFFGQPIDGAGGTASGRNSFITAGGDAGDNAPLQIVQYHYLTLRMSTNRLAGEASGSYGLHTTVGDEITFNVRADHINIAALGNAAVGVSASFHVYAELTNIDEKRMVADYISGSGVNTL